MTNPVDYDIVGSYNNQRISSIDAERSINMFEYIDSLGKKKKCLINTSGLINSNITFVGASNGFRAQFIFNNIEYSVIGNSVYRSTPSGGTSLLGTLTTSFGYVGVDANTFQVIFVDGAKGYTWDTTVGNVLPFQQITDKSFPLMPIDVCYLDGFFVVVNGNTNKFRLSSFDQGMVWGPAANNFTVPISNTLTIGLSTIGGDTTTANYATGVLFSVSASGGGSVLPTGLSPSVDYYSIFVDSTHIKVATSYANAVAGTFINITAGSGSGTFTITSRGQLQEGSVTSHPGTLVACRTLHRKLFLFSQFFTEVWENAGIGTNLPFRRNNSLLMEYGTAAIGSIAVGFDKMIFLSQDRDGLGAVMEVIGTESIPISNRALDFQLAQYAAVNQVSDCVGFLIKENGLIFYRMNFTAANHTFVYNVTLSNPQQEETKLWHEEEVLSGDRHPAQTHVYFNGLNYVGHYSLPILYLLDSNTFTNDGQAIRRTRISKAFCPPGYQRTRVDRLQIDLLQGNISALGSSFLPFTLNTENGLTLTTESGLDILLEQALPLYNPLNLEVFLSISKDGGQTYGYKKTATMGKIGQRTFRTVYRKIGTTKRGQAFVTKTEFFQAVPLVILGASWVFEILPE